MQKIDKTIIYILLTLGVVFYFLYLVNDILTPFVAALVLSYFLSPLVDKLASYKIPRYLATLTAISVLFFIICLLSLTIIPVIFKQAQVLSERISNHSDEIKILSSATIQKIQNLDPELVDKIESTIGNFSSSILSFATNLLGNILYSSALAINILSIFFITPFVMYYMLLSWGSITSTCANMVPKRYRKHTTKLTSDINKTLSLYLRGQTMVCLTLGTFYAISFSIIGLESGIALGFISGFLAFIPYAGALFSSTLCVIISAIQFGNLTAPFIIICLFAFAQSMESTYLTPKLVGGSVGLNPAWIIFGLLAGGAAMGFVGVLIALPLTATLAVIIKFAIEQYKTSKFYN
jgi:predicted PurR-regulated permease PerM